MQKKHKTKHKKQCERRVAELHDIELFKQPPPKEDDCPICFIRLPLLCSGRKYKSCCGKVICGGCIHAVQKADGFVGLCPFCRVPTAITDEENTTRLKKRVDAGDTRAIHNLAGYYNDGKYGLPRDDSKASELFHRAAELGHSKAFHNIGCAYNTGRGVNRDMTKAVYYWEIAAMKGDVNARYNLGVCEEKSGNIDRALKHYVLALEGGKSGSLKNVQRLYSKGKATKEEYARALRAYQKYLSEVKSPQRDEAAAYNEGYKYID